MELTIRLPDDLEDSLRDEVHKGRFVSVDEAIAEAVRRLVLPSPSSGNQLSEAEFQQHLLDLGLMTQLPETAADFDDPDDVPIAIEGEPLSETVIRERRWMAAYVFDTSALVKRHVREPGSAWVRSLTQAGTPHSIGIARITAVELVAAVTRRQRGGSLSAAQAGSILGHFYRHLAQRYQVLELTPFLLADAMRLARTHGLRAYDAVQLAAGIELNRLSLAAGLGPATRVSADRELNAAATVENLAVDDPHNHP